MVSEFNAQRTTANKNERETGSPEHAEPSPRPVNQVWIHVQDAVTNPDFLKLPVTASCSFFSQFTPTLSPRASSGTSVQSVCIS